MKHNDRRGWLCPDGTFIGSAETPAVTMRGLSLGGHEQAALDYLSDPKRAHLLGQLYDYAHAEAERLNIDFNDWTDLDGHDVIKRFMVSKGFKRVAPDE